MCACCTTHGGFSHTNSLFPYPHSGCTLATHTNFTLQSRNEKSRFWSSKEMLKKKKIRCLWFQLCFHIKHVGLLEKIKKSQESSITERKTIVMFVTHIKYMLWWFCYVRHFKNHGMVCIRHGHLQRTWILKARKEN